jgi:PhoPQ-activated pathogenicity-related protein
MKLARFLRSSRFWLAAAFTAAALVAADHSRRGATTTALDRYVSQPDPAFHWAKVASAQQDGVTGHVLDLVSQRWLQPSEVDRTEWRHWLIIVRPDQLEHRTALLVISGGANRPGNPPRPSRELIEIAKATRSVVVELRMVPNQSLVFDGDGKERKEDDLIAYTWDKFLRTGDERWPARLPMTKAAVRAMDAAIEFLATDAGGQTTVENFVVAGASKRGWTTWTTAIVDQRVVAICPLVIDILNTEKSMAHHYQAYGFFAPAVGDYSRHGIMDWTGTRESRALYAIEDPYSYRDRLDLPKLLVNACGDQFFLPDSSQFYFGDLPGVKYLRYVPNTDHSLKNSDAFQTLQAWHEAIVRRVPLPQLTWRRQADGTLVVETRTPVREAKLWQAVNPKARDFRLDTIGPAWKATALVGTDGRYTASLAAPEQGWAAHFIELTYDLGLSAPLKVTTQVVVTPETLPFPAPTFTTPRGFMSQ